MFRGVRIRRRTKGSLREYDFYTLFPLTTHDRIHDPGVPPQRDAWMLQPPAVSSSSRAGLASTRPRLPPAATRFSDPRDQGEKDDREYEEVNPQLNSCAPRVSSESIASGAIRVDVSDAGRDWRERIRRRRRHSGDEDGFRVGDLPSTYDRDRYVSMRSSMMKPGEDRPRASLSGRKRPPRRGDSSGPPRKRQRRRNFGSISEDTLAQKALQAKIRGHEEEFARLQEKMKQRDAKIHSRAPSDPIREEDSSRLDYDLGMRRLVVSDRDFDENEVEVSSLEYKGTRRRGKRGNPMLTEVLRVGKRGGKIRTIQERCRLCFRGDTFKKHLVVALGDRAWIGLPPWGQFVPNHCVIVPYEHRVAMSELEDEETREIMRFKKAAVDFFESIGHEPFFLETVTSYGREKLKHGCIECIPVPFRVSVEGRSFFHKAMTDADVRWATNRRVIDTGGKGIRRSVPKGFSYFHVEFGFRGGLAHVIEDEAMFPFMFGKQVIAGMLRMDANRVKGTPWKSEIVEKRNVLEFLSGFKPYDWTTEL